jgi:serine/threonine-protein kinase
MTTPPSAQVGRYRIVEELGRGAMGVVYLADDDSLQRRVAIKMLQLTGDADERAMHEARFRQEAKAAGGLNHPNIITIYDMGREGDWLYIAMELLEGSELRDLMTRGRLPLHVSVHIAAQVAAGLASAHARGVVHRDIKPSNIMVLADHTAKIMDFGIARVQSSDVRTQTGMIMGSPKYMSPEQAAARPIDTRSDIFSLGSILYEMTAGVAPFSGDELSSLMFNIATHTPTRPSEINAAVPELLDLIIAKAMQKDPALRYADARELASDLTDCRALFGAGAQDLVAPGVVGDSAISANTAMQKMSPTVQDSTVASAMDTEPTLMMPPGEGQAGAMQERTVKLATPSSAGVDQGDRRIAAPVLVLLPSRKFDSSAGLLHLMQSSFTTGASGASYPREAPATLMWNPQRLAWTAAIVLAALCAVLIVLY